MSTPRLVAQGGLPRVLVGREGVPLRRGSLLGDAEVRAIDCHRAVVEHVVRAQPALKFDLRLRGGAATGGVRPGCLVKSYFFWK